MFWTIVNVIGPLVLSSAAIVNLLFAVKNNKQVKAYFWAAVMLFATATLAVTALNLVVEIVKLSLPDKSI